MTETRSNDALEYGGFSSVPGDGFATVDEPTWAQKNADGVPYSTTISKIPQKLANNSIESFGLFDFGLVECNNFDCNDGLRVEKITNSSQPIGVYIEIDRDDPSKFAAQPTNIGSENFKIEMILKWTF